MLGKDFEAKIPRKLDARLPGTTITEIAQNLRKEADLTKKVETMDSRLSNVEKSVAKILSNQEAQTALVQQLVAAQTSTSPLLDDNKKGRKKTHLSQLVKEGQHPPELDIIDLIQLAASKLRSKELINQSEVEAVEKAVNAQWQKLSENIKEIFGQIENPDKIFHHYSQVEQISVSEMSLGSLEKGQTSCIKSPKAKLVLKPKRNYPKTSDKNPLDLMFETPKPDEKKLLARSIAFFKDPADSVLKRRIAKIYRNDSFHELLMPSTTGLVHRRLTSIQVWVELAIAGGFVVGSVLVAGLFFGDWAVAA
ncbi:hypothetical protein AgCh_012428 [Apium graveolens]